MSDLELYKGLKKGDRKTIESIYDQFLPKINQWITHNSGTKEDASDIFQETLETILLKVKDVNRSFEGLVMTIAKRKWIDRLRKTATKAKSKEEIIKLNEGKQIYSEEEYNLNQVGYQKYILMEKYFLQLSKTCQKVMTMMKQGISVNDIVEALSLSSANTLYRRKAACIDRWSKLIKLDPNYKNILS